MRECIFEICFTRNTQVKGIERLLLSATWLYIPSNKRCSSRCYMYLIRRSFTYYYEAGREKYPLSLRERYDSPLSRSPSPSLAINNSARGRFLWLRNKERSRGARLCSRLSTLSARSPMYCTTPSGIAPSRRDRIARYNGPLHNGIRTCDIPRAPSSRVPSAGGLWQFYFCDAYA